jgi:hypothetical protein
VTSPIASFVGVVFTADVDTPAESLPYAGQTFLIPPEYLTAIGSGPSNPGVLIGIRGYHVAAGPTGHQWLMTAPIGNAVRDAILAIPGAHSWTVPAAAATYRNMALVLIRDFGVPAPSAVTALTNLYNAAVTNDHTAAPGG